MVANGEDLSRYVTAQDIGKRTDGHTFVVRREKCRHSCTGEDFLRVPYPLQDPIGPQTFVSQLEIRREILRRFPRRNRIACGMAARALEFHEKVGANTQSLRVRLDIGRNKRIVDPIQRRKITFDRGCLLFREVERWHSSR